MRFVEEVVVEEFLPTFRSLLAGELRERGLTQQAVAETLGVSQSAVSKYAQGEVAVNEAVAADDRVRELAERLAEELASGEISRVGALVEAEVLVRELEAPGDLLARLHEEEMPALAEYEGDFLAYDPAGEIRERERVLASVRQGVRVLEHASGFAAHIPNVGSNLVECLPDAESIEDVAGVPGRVFDVKGQTAVPSDPEFGVSEHVAGVLLAARRGGSDARAALNVSYSEDVLHRLADLGHSAVEFDASDGEVTDAVADSIAADPDATVVYQTGGFGVEPIIYVLADSAVAAAEIARELVR